MINSQVLVQAVQTRPWVKDTLLVLGASVLMALSAHVRIPLPFTPVPVSMQSFAVLYLAMMLGSKRGPLAVLAYLAQGASGLPVFSGGNTGLVFMAGPTGGYLLGFVVAAYFAGMIVERSRTKGIMTVAAAMLAGTAAIYLLGVAWLSRFVGGYQPAIALGVTPFLIGDGIKMLLAITGKRAIKGFKRG